MESGQEQLAIFAPDLNNLRKVNELYNQCLNA